LNLATVLTVRTNSDRLPGKALLKVNNQPLIYWIVKRLVTLPGKVILATTGDSSDDKLADYVTTKLGLPVYRDEAVEVNDVVGRIGRAIDSYYPQADLVFRALGDCPFIEPSIVQRAAHCILKYKTDFFYGTCRPTFGRFTEQENSPIIALLLTGLLPMPGRAWVSANM